MVPSLRRCRYVLLSYGDFYQQHDDINHDGHISLDVRLNDISHVISLNDDPECGVQAFQNES